MDTRISQQLLRIIPILDSTRHKGQNGKVAIIGGSLEFTGAPYYAAISSLRGGGDLAYIFCSKSSAIPIKSYSPECIVYPILCNEGNEDISEKNQKQMMLDLNTQSQIMSSLIIGPGLGRELKFGDNLTDLLSNSQKLTILDADALWYLAQKQNTIMNLVINNPKQYILTPNAMEIKRLQQYFQIDEQLTNYVMETKNTDGFCEINLNVGYPKMISTLSQRMNNVVILAKGEYDIITDGIQGYCVFEPGSMKRCGGQGDILSGLCGLYCSWAYHSKNNIMNGCILASLITRNAAQLAYTEHHYSLTTPMIIDKIGQSFERITSRFGFKIV